MVCPFDVVESDENVTMECTSSSNPRPTNLTLEWRHDAEIMEDTTGGTYTIYRVEKDDRGIYTCAAKNIIGSGVDACILDVLCKSIFVFLSLIL